MHYLIDGYNLLFQSSIEEFPLIRGRLGVIGLLEELMSESKLRGSVIFDSSKENALDHPSKSTSSYLEIIFSPSNTSADNYILEYIIAFDPPSQLTVVTSDRDLGSQAKQLGANIIKVETFLKKLRSKLKKNQSEKEEAHKQSADSQDHIDRLLEIFEQRYKNQ